MPSGKRLELSQPHSRALSIALRDVVVEDVRRDKAVASAASATVAATAAKAAAESASVEAKAQLAGPVISSNAPGQFFSNQTQT